MGDIPDTLGWLLVAFAAAAADLVWKFTKPLEPGLRAAEPEAEAEAYDPMEAYAPEGEWTLADWRNEYEGRAVPPGGVGWVECACCGCPTLDGALDYPECEVCGWNGDVDGLEEARVNFSRYGSVHAPLDPDLLPGSRARPPRPGMPLPEPAFPLERNAALEVVAVAASVAPGEEPGPGFWEKLGEKLEALRRIRGERAYGAPVDER
ncbi:MAG TPA: hypothetical protein VHG08_07810 [Longimicrobium sp.]|nr:hypothetical protein [Longimicrobium sp.]